MFDPNTLVVPARRVAFRSIGEQVVLVNPDDNVMLTLNDTGSVVWEALDGKRTIGDISVVVAKEFDVTLDQAERDVVEFLTSMLSRKLVEVGSGGK